MGKNNKVTDLVTLEDLLVNWTQCNYFMKAKNRLCNMGRSPGSLFCGNHRPPGEEVQSSRIKRRAELAGLNVIERVACPIDPSHDVYKHDLDWHIRVCNIQAVHKKLKSKPYYQFNCNGGSNVTSTDVEFDSVDPDVLLSKVVSCFNEIYPEISKDLSRSESESGPVPAFEDIPNQIKERIISVVAAGQSTFEKLRHAHQDVAIVHQMILNGFLPPPSHPLQLPDETAAGGTALASSANPLSSTPASVLVELGAGRGLLGLAVKAVYPSLPLVLVERSGVRRKADRNLRGLELDFARVRMDIRHLLLWRLPELTDRMHGLPAAPLPSTATDSQAPPSARPFLDDGEGCARQSLGRTDRADDRAAVDQSEGGVDRPEHEWGSGDRAAPDRGTDSDRVCVVLMAKHLCGLASDLAIRCALSDAGNSTSLSPTLQGEKDSNQPSQTQATCYPCDSDPSAVTVSVSALGGTGGSEQPTVGRPKPLRRIAIATCCHHACSWEDYTGAEWLADRGFRAAEFEYLKHWSGWAHTLKGRVKDASGRIVKTRRGSEVVGEPVEMSAVTGGDGGQTQILGSEGKSIGDTNNGSVETADLGVGRDDYDRGDKVGASEATEETGEREADNRGEHGDIDAPAVHRFRRPRELSCEGMSGVGWMVKRLLDQVSERAVLVHMTVTNMGPSCHFDSLE